MSDLALAVVFTNMTWMPFQEGGKIVYGFDLADLSLHNIGMLFIILFAVGGIMDALLHAYSIFFEDLELGKRVKMLLRAQRDFMEETRQRLAATSGQTLRRMSLPAGKDLPGKGCARTTPGVHISTVPTQTLATLSLTGGRLVSKIRWSRYVREGAIDGLLRALCLASWLNSVRYSREDYEAASPGYLHPETVLSCTVILLWLRSLQILEVFQTTGPLVVMLSSIWKDVVRSGRTPTPLLLLLACLSYRCFPAP